MDENPHSAEIQHQSSPPQEDKPTSSTAPHTKASNSDSSSDDLLKKYDNTLPLTEQQLVKYLRKVSTVLFNRITKDHWEKHEEAAVNYANLKASIDDYYDENITHRDQTDKLVEASMRSLDKSRNTTSDLFKGLNVITELLKKINNAIKDDPTMNKKISKATESFSKISTNIIEVLSLVKGFNFFDLRSSVNALQAHALKQDEKLAAWAKSSTNMAWNLGSRISGLERAQKHIQSSMSSLKEDSLSIKTMMTEMYEVFKGQSSGSVTPPLALTHIPANVEGKNATKTATKDPPSHTKGETDANKQEKPNEYKHSTDSNIEFIGSSKPQPSITQAQLITTINPEQIIHKEKAKVHIDKEERIKKAEEEAMLFKISKPEVIKVVREEAKKLGIHLKEAITTKVGKIFKNAQDAEHEVLKRQHTKKVRKSLKLRKHKYDNYMWTISSRLKPKTITDVSLC
ncbi:hypothetical protein Tco_0996219, partial [Tanacetum coccineum]